MLLQAHSCLQSADVPFVILFVIPTVQAHLLMPEDDRSWPQEVWGAPGKPWQPALSLCMMLNCICLPSTDDVSLQSVMLLECRSSVQRVARRAGVITRQHHALLEEIGFDWSGADALS